MISRPFAALIFDQDGTLLDAEALHCKSWCEVAGRLGVPFDEPTFSSFAGKGDLRIAEHVKILLERAARRGEPPPTPAELVARKRAHYKRHLDALELMPGARALLERARAVAVPTAMATISPAEETARVVARHGLDRLLEVVVHRESEVPGRPGERVRSKPEPDIYLAAAALLGVAPEACCAFEDSLTGVSAAKAAGMTAVAIPTRYSRHFDFGAADAVVDSLGDVELSDDLRLTLAAGARLELGRAAKPR